MKRKFHLLLLPSIILLAGSSCYELDHFKVYRVDPVKVSESLRLKSQFDRAHRSYAIVELSYFAAPVDKNGEGIYDADAHLAWYRLDANSQPSRVVNLSNQFGAAEWNIEEASFLLVPSSKVISEKGTLKPLESETAHFVCYRANAVDCGTDVVLVDQFDTHLGRRQETKVLTPKYFCAPVSKVWKDDTTAVAHEADHLAVYSIANSLSTDIGIEITNQFILGGLGSQKLQIQDGVLIAVPTEKISWDRSSNESPKPDN